MKTGIVTELILNKFNSKKLIITVSDYFKTQRLLITINILCFNQVNSGKSHCQENFVFNKKIRIFISSQKIKNDLDVFFFFVRILLLHNTLEG